MAGQKTFAFVKFFKEEAHAEEFITGSLYMNRLSYFQKLEDSADHARPDQYEATAVWLQPELLEITFSDHPELKITGSDLAAPVSMAFDAHKHLHLFCLYGIQMDDPASYGEIELQDAEKRLRKSAEIDVRCCSEFGAYAVIVPATPFIDRLKSVLKSSGKTVQAGLVKYYDEKTFNGSFKFNEIPFKKQSFYSYQNEYRICIQTNTSGDDAMRFELGDMSAFCAKIPAADVNKAFQVNLSLLAKD